MSLRKFHSAHRAALPIKRWREISYIDLARLKVSLFLTRQPTVQTKFLVPNEAVKGSCETFSGELFTFFLSPTPLCELAALTFGCTAIALVYAAQNMGNVLQARNRLLYH